MLLYKPFRLLLLLKTKCSRLFPYTVDCIYIWSNPSIDSALVVYYSFLDTTHPSPLIPLDLVPTLISTIVTVFNTLRSYVFGPFCGLMLVDNWTDTFSLLCNIHLSADNSILFPNSFPWYMILDHEILISNFYPLSMVAHVARFVFFFFYINMNSIVFEFISTKSKSPTSLGGKLKTFYVYTKRLLNTSWTICIECESELLGNVCIVLICDILFAFTKNEKKNAMKYYF